MLLQSFSYNLSGIIPYENYIYEIENINANWPVKILPLSGAINSPRNSATIDSKIIFCENLSACSGYMNYSNDLYQLGEDPFIDLRVKLTADSLDYPIYSDITSIVCSGCFVVPSINISPNTISLEDNNSTELVITFNNLKPYTEYFYVFNDVNSNYPVSLTNIPKSGSFISDSTDSYNLRANLVFCYYEDCSSPTFGSGNTQKIEQQQCEKYYSNFNLSLSSNYLISSIVSDTTTLECDNCLPKTTISAPPLISLNNATSNKYSLITNFDGLKSYNRYEYSILFKEANHRVSFSNLSGYFYTKNETNKNIETTLAFCESSGLCEYVYDLGDIIDYDCSKNKYIDFNIQLNSDCLDNSILSDSIRIECENCLPRPEILIPAPLTLSSGNFYPFSVTFRGLRPYTEYNYSIEDIDTNHLISFKELSGVLKTRNNTVATISNNLTFCENNTYCSSPYSTGLLNNDICNNVLFSDFKIKLDSNCLSTSIFSNKIEVSCNNCIPTINIVTPNNISLTSENIATFDISMIILKPYTQYTYSIKDINTNHLIGFKNLSGIITTRNNTAASITNDIVFCESSGYCNSYSTTGTLNNDVCNNLLSADFRVELDSVCLSNPIVSNRIQVDCDNCIPKINVVLSGDANNILTSTNLASLTGIITGLKPYQDYIYYFTGDNNWPIVLDNISGTFTPKTTSSSIVTKLLFCSPSGSCSNENGLLSYQPSTPAQKAINNNFLYGKLKLNVKSLNCSDVEYSSNTYNINCDDCLPCLTYANAVISGSPTIILDDECCAGQKLLTVSITNAIPGDQYIYEFSTSSGVGINSIVFNPVSGEMYFGSGGAGTINTICSVDLADYSQTLINFELTNTNTNFKVFDTVGLVCNTGSCY